MADDDHPSALTDLEGRLREVQNRRLGLGSSASADETEPAGGRSMVAVAYQIFTEMVAAVVIGVGGGLLIDHWLGTKPWGLVILCFLGIGAAGTNIYFTVRGEKC